MPSFSSSLIERVLFAAVNATMWDSFKSLRANSIVAYILYKGRIVQQSQHKICIIGIDFTQAKSIGFYYAHVLSRHIPSEPGC